MYQKNSDGKSTLLADCCCGNFSLEWNVDLSSIPAVTRACQCSYCFPRNIRWLSVNDSSLFIKVKNIEKHSITTNGTKTAHFHECIGCSVTVFASTVISGETYAVININGTTFNLSMTGCEQVSFTNEGLSDRINRRKGTWIKNVYLQH